VAGQSDLAERVRKITVPVRDGGILSVSSGAWTHSSLGSTRRDVIFDNTCYSGGYYLATSATDVLVDEGQLPGPGNSFCLPGCASSYTVDAFRFSYCTENTVPEAVIRFDNLYQPCNPYTIFDPEVASFTLVGLPVRRKRVCSPVGR
jgi:hypothetical protein